MADTGYTITDLGILPGFTSVSAKAINDRGQIIGELRRSGKTSHAYLWDSGRMHRVGKVTLNGINNQGRAVGTEYIHSRGHDFFRAVIVQDGVVNPLLINDDLLSLAMSVNDNNQVVGRVMTNIQSIENLEDVKPEDVKYDGFIWQDGERRDLPLPLGFRRSEAVAVNEQGDVVGLAGRVQLGGPILEQAVMWDGDKVTLLGLLPGFEESQAVAINNRRQVLVHAKSQKREVMEEIMRRAEAGESTETLTQFEADNHPINSWRYFIWESGHKQEIEARSAFAINDHGQVVGSDGWRYNDFGQFSQPISAFIWQGGKKFNLQGLIPLNSGWELMSANDINNHGQIVGNGLHNGKERAFLLTPTAS